jgi:hypothetical protein
MDIDELLDRLRRLAKRREDDGSYTDASLVSAAVDKIETLFDALNTAEKADKRASNCEDHEPDAAPETCERCFPLADDARTKRWTALGINQPLPSGNLLE